MNLVEAYRERVMRHMMAKDSISKGWGHRQPIMRRCLAPLSGAAVLNLGNSLSDIFQAYGKGSSLVADGTSGQSALSGGGAAWSILVAWYLNMCYCGTNTIALEGSKFVPGCIKDALSVNYGSNEVGADLDVLVISLPKELASLEHTGKESVMLQTIEETVSRSFKEMAVVILQCKTNWNDNAQIPMLWNLLYKFNRAGRVPANGFVMGKGSYSLQDFGYFAYAFATVPTNNLSNYKTTSMPVLRVQGMTGGAYWGRPTERGISLSITEFFKHQNSHSPLMPSPGVIGLGYANEILSHSGKCDVGIYNV